MTNAIDTVETTNIVFKAFKLIFDKTVSTKYEYSQGMAINLRPPRLSPLFIPGILNDISATELKTIHLATHHHLFKIHTLKCGYLKRCHTHFGALFVAYGIHQCPALTCRLQFQITKNNQQIHANRKSE